MLLEDEYMGSEGGKRITDLYEAKSAELFDLTMSDDGLRAQAVATLRQINAFLATDESKRHPQISSDLVQDIDQFVERYEKVANDALQHALAQIREELAYAANRTPEEAFG